MTCDDLNKFIQVNIYGRTLQELRKQGIVLESILNDIGCSDIWIGEGCMYNTMDSHNNFCSTGSKITKDEPIIEQAPVLSTTLAAIKCPRFSTPVVENRVELERKFTLNLPQKFSRINTSFMDKWIDETEYERDVEDVLHEMIEKVVKEREQFSTTITKVNFPRYSTPIPSHEHFLDKSAFKVPDAISEIESDAEEEVMSGFADEPSEETTVVTGEENVQSGKENEEELVVHRVEQEVLSVTSISPKIRRSRRLSAPQLKNTLKVEELSEPMKKRPAFSRCSTEIKPAQIALPNSRSAHPVLYENEYLEITAQNEDTFRVDNSDKSESDIVDVQQVLEEVVEETGKRVEAPKFENRQYSEAAFYPHSFDDGGGEGDQFYSLDDQLMSHEEVVEEQRIYQDLKPLQQFENQYSYDLDNDYHAGDQSDHNSFQSTDETAQIDVDDSIRIYFPPSPTRTPTKSILKNAESENTTKKGVSFKVPKPRDKEKERERRERTHIITCSFEDCNKTIHWKLRYGKRRLLDHAFSHCEEKFVECRSCEFLCQTTCQMKYHYKKAHTDIKMSGFGIYSIPYDDTVVEKLWDDCFGAQKKIVGIVSRRRSKLAQLDETEVIDVEEEEERGELIDKETTIFLQ